METRDREEIRISVRSVEPLWADGIRPQYRVTVSAGARTHTRHLYASGDIAQFAAGVRLGFAERHPGRLEERFDGEIGTELFYDGVNVGLEIAGVRVPLCRSPYSGEPYALACEEAGD